jgi:hypothetical protein
MRKTVYVTWVAVLLVRLWVTGALAYDIDNVTQVQPWFLDSPHGAFRDAATHPIQGAPHEFNTYGANWDAATSILTIFTDFSPIQDGSLGVTTADLFINLGCDDTYDLAVGLDSNPKGKGLTRVRSVYDTTSFQTSQDRFKNNGGVIYGGQVGAAPHAIPVLAGGAPIGSTAVVWGPGDGTALHSVEVDLTGIVSGDWCFIWGTGTCGNGPMEGHVVPLPPAVFLLGFGLLGLGLTGRRRRS